MAYSLSGLTLFHPSCHPQPSSYTGLLKCAKRVPISGPLCQLFPLQGILFPLTSAWLAAFCLDLSLAITFQRSKENSCSTVVAQPLSRHLILPLWIMLTTTWDCALLVRLILCFPLPEQESICHDYPLYPQARNRPRSRLMLNKYLLNK